jgi:imidazolonepropionase-like amidohydrolase
MYTIQKYCSYVPLNELVKWATLNGAEALGYEETLGSLTVGKTPGINVIDIHNINEKWMMRSDSVKKIA